MSCSSNWHGGLDARSADLHCNYMKAKLVRIGNSRGLRIPKPVLEQAGLVDDVDIRVEGNNLVISPARHAREGWAQAFREMAENEDDALPDVASVENEWDDEEWKW